MTKVLASVALLALPALALCADVRMKEGLWEISTSMDIPNLPFKMPPQVVKHCYTKEEVARSEGGIPEQQKDCKLVENARSGNKLRWKVVCTGKSAGKGEGEIVFTSATSYEGWMKFDTGGQAMTTKYSARRVGDCK